MPISVKLTLRFLLATVVAASSADAAVDYARDVQPILQKRCYGCHGPGQQMSGLRLDRRAVAMRVIKPGDSSASKLHAVVSGAGKLRMPPSGPPMPANEIAVIDAWIDSGASWPADDAPARVPWSFAKLRRPDSADCAERALEAKPDRCIHSRQAERTDRYDLRHKRTEAHWFDESTSI